MAQNIIFPDGPLFMVDRGWKNPHKDSAVPVVPCWNKKSQLSRQRHEYEAPAVTVQTSPQMKGTASEHDANRTGTAMASASPPASGLKFEFINVAGSRGDRDPALRRLVRSHVMKGSHRSQKPRRKPAQEEASRGPIAGTSFPNHTYSEPEIEVAASFGLSLVPPGSATSFYGILPCPMEPHYYGLLQYYIAVVAHTLYPLESHLSFNPVKKSWFPLAIADELLLHTVLFSAAVSLSLAQEHRQSAEASNIMKPIFRLLASRLKDQSNIPDATIGAVSCLAMIENMLGNHAKWRVHARGLREMIRTRGGLSAIDPGLQMKICRADIEGAVDSVSAPQLPPIIRSHPPIYLLIQPSKALPQNNHLPHLLSSSDISPQLRTTLLDLARFSSAIDHALSRPEVFVHPKAFDEDVISLQQNLLGTPSKRESGLATTCRLGALIYLKTLTRESPFSPSSSKVILHKLENSLTLTAEEPKPAALLLWLYFMGGIASQGLPARSWFMDKLVEFVLRPGELLTWASAKKVLRKILWIEMIHEGPCRQLWDQAEKTRAMSIGRH